MSEEIKNQQAAEPEALTETEINEQMQGLSVSSERN